MAVVEGTAFEIEIENEENGLRNKHPDIILVKRLCFNDFLQQISQNTIMIDSEHFVKVTKKQIFFNSRTDVFFETKKRKKCNILTLLENVIREPLHRFQIKL
jgi:hypothetical protein